MNHDHDDPYDILGVSRDATTAEIKTAYRKLALRNHPDKVEGDANAKARASQVFTKIGAAYEILSDDQERKEYDARSDMMRNGQSSSPFGMGMGGMGGHPGFGMGMGGMGGHPGFGMGMGGGGFTDPFFDFHRRAHADPFDLFERVFAEEFGMMGGRGARHSAAAGFAGDETDGRGAGRRQQQRPRDPFDDPFFGGDPFFSSPFGSSRMGGGGLGGFGMMGQMMQQMQQCHRDAFENIGAGSRPGSLSYSSSSYNSSSGGPGSESVTTTTRIVDGKRVTRTERTFVKPDGTVERHVETTGDGDPNMLPNSSHAAPAIEEGRSSDGRRSGLFGRKRSSRKK